MYIHFIFTTSRDYIVCDAVADTAIEFVITICYVCGTIELKPQYNERGNERNNNRPTIAQIQEH